MTIANNPASALERVLRTLITSGASTVHQGWADTLDVAPGSVAFVQRHAEVVNLLARVHSHLAALPDERSEKSLYLKYVPAWYGAVVYPDGWRNTQHPAAHVISHQDLDHLQGLGTIMGLLSPEPELTDDKLKALTDSLAEWRKLLEETGLEPGLVQQIRTQVDHIAWLLSNVETFGVEPVTEGARNLFGMAMPIVAKGGKWKTKVAAALAGLVIFLSPIEQATDQTTNILKNLSETVQIIEHFGEPDEPQKALPAGQGDGRAIEQGEEKRAIEGPQQTNGESPEG